MPAAIWKDRVIAWLVLVSKQHTYADNVPARVSRGTAFRSVEWRPLLEANSGKNYECFDVEPDDGVYVFPCTTPTWAVLCDGIQTSEVLGFSSVPPADIGDEDWHAKAAEYLARKS